METIATLAQTAGTAAAYTAHPERFVRQAPIPPPLPTAAWINPPRPAPAPKQEMAQ